MENNKNKKSVKFLRDMLNFCDFIQVFVFTRNHHLNVLFCEPTENCEYKRKLYMYRVTEFRTSMLTFTNYGPLKRSAELAY